MWPEQDSGQDIYTTRTAELIKGQTQQDISEWSSITLSLTFYSMLWLGIVLWCLVTVYLLNGAPPLLYLFIKNYFWYNPAQLSKYQRSPRITYTCTLKRPHNKPLRYEKSNKIFYGQRIMNIRPENKQYHPFPYYIAVNKLQLVLGIIIFCKFIRQNVVILGSYGCLCEHGSDQSY